jgi:hypothetical protein
MNKIFEILGNIFGFGMFYLIFFHQAVSQYWHVGIVGVGIFIAFLCFFFYKEI